MNTPCLNPKGLFPDLFATRELARAAGHRSYFPGETCRKGHVAPRMVLVGTCCECMRIDDEKRAAKAAQERKLKRALANINTFTTETVRDKERIAKLEARDKLKKEKAKQKGLEKRRETLARNKADKEAELAAAMVPELGASRPGAGSLGSSVDDGSAPWD